MKYLDEYRDGGLARKLIAEIAGLVTRPHVLMEICGGQTHSIVRSGLDRLLPLEVELVHGPGCPVCVTALEMIDRAHTVARRPEVIFCSFGDMLRVPGSETDLLSLRSCGADVRVVYSPMDALRLAREHPEREVVFFAIGFETTAPANAMAVWQARREGVANFSLLVSQVLVPPAIESILVSPDNRIEGFLGPGHVCTVMGFEEYGKICERFGVPIVIAGFEAVDLLEGILMLVRQREEGRAEVENPYSRAVRREGNAGARARVAEVFEVTDRHWRGVGLIPRSGLRLREAFWGFDAERRFGVEEKMASEPEICISGRILLGERRPHECPAFGRECTPEHPLGATMVSGEGACAAYYRYGRHLDVSAKAE
jgi:hydrogenase expression/formation protein HypD